VDDSWPLAVAAAAFAAAVVFVVFGGVRTAGLADVLADRLGIGEALFGTMVLAAVSSLPGVVVTATSAWHDQPALAYGNAVGGIAAQTAALAIADIAYRRANLEHAAASLSNIFFGLLLVAMLIIVSAVPLLADYTLLGLHPGSFALVAVYWFGVKEVRQVDQEPLWHPHRTRETRLDVPADDAGTRRFSTRRLLVEFIAVGAAVSVAGWVLARSADAVVARTALSPAFVGTILLGVANALPETVLAVTAVRRGAVTLAMAGVLGGNAFDVLNLVVGDAFYGGGSLYHAASRIQLLLVLMSALMATTIAAGLLRRERSGIGNIGFESAIVMVIYAVSVVLLWTEGG
jgi:cation:H+ antiporter